MTPILLKTKLFIPHFMGKPVERQRLFDMLDRGLAFGARLILVNAPAGFGKTTLVAEWGKTLERFAWLSLDESENDPQSFLVYLIAALQTVLPGFGEDALEFIHNTPSLPLEIFITMILNELTAQSDSARIVLALDDYHVIQNSHVQKYLDYLFERLPPNLTLVLLSRAIPGFHLGRIRARQQLLEIQADDLRFTTGEAEVLLNMCHGLQLEMAQVDALDERTEGWATGLQLAALALKQQQLNTLENILPLDSLGGVQEVRTPSLTGYNEFIMDYLAEEVLDRQPVEIQQFLLKTSILDRLSGSLCDWVSQQTGTSSLLIHLWRQGLFLVSLDSERCWFRYHALFAGFLRTRLKLLYPNELGELYYRAKDWFLKNGLPDEALKAGLAGADPARIIDLFKENWVDMLHEGQVNLIVRWMENLPQQEFEVYPLLGTGFGWALCLSGRFNEVLPQIKRAERVRTMQIASGKLAAESNENRRISADIAILHSFLSRQNGDAAASAAYARSAKHFSEGFPLMEGNATLLLAQAYREMGHFSEAICTFQDAIPLVWSGGNGLGALGAMFAIGQLYQIQGQLDEAEKCILEGLRFGSENGLAHHPYRAIFYLAMADISIGRGHISEACAHFEQGISHSRYGGDLEFLRYRALVQARLDIERGMAKSSLSILENTSAELHLMGARLAALELDLEFCKILARLKRYSEATEHLEMITRQSLSGYLNEMVIRLRKDFSKTGHIKTDASISVAREQVLSSIDTGKESRIHKVNLAEPLTKRELEILTLIAEGSSNQQMADRLCVSLSTIKKHVSSLLGKLGATSRTQALVIGRKAGLL